MDDALKYPKTGFVIYQYRFQNWKGIRSRSSPRGHTALYHVDLIDLDHAERELFEYIEMFYNNQRLHAYLDYVSPALFERLSLKKAA